MGARRVTTAVIACAIAATTFVAPAGAGAATAYPPTAVGVDGQGTAYVGDATTGQIRRYDRDGTYLGAWGTFGAGQGQIQGVVDIDVDAQGVVWVLEVRNRLQAYTTTGTFLRETPLQLCRLGTPVFAPGNGGVDATSDGVWVASPCADKVTRYSRDLANPDRDFVVASPSGISVRNGRVYVGRRGAGDVQIYGTDGNLQRTQALPAEAWDVFVDSFDVLHVSDIANNVIRLLGSDGVEFRTLGRTGSNPGDLRQPYRFDVGEQGAGSIAGDLFIADHGNSRIQRFNSFGSTLFTRLNDGAGATPPVDPPPTPVGRTGVTVNQASAFTNSRNVTLGIVPPAGATGVLLSNDGGFGAAEARTLAGNSQYPWTLASSGADRLPKQVYVRFTGGGVDEDKTFSDDIVLDQTGATVRRATFQNVAGAAAARPGTGKGKAVRLSVRASDANSGVRTLAISSKPGGANTLYVANRRTLTVRLVSTDRVYVRAIDRAGNAGAWKRATRK